MEYCLCFPYRSGHFCHFRNGKFHLAFYQVCVVNLVGYVYEYYCKFSILFFQMIDEAVFVQPVCFSNLSFYFVSFHSLLKPFLRYAYHYLCLLRLVVIYRHENHTYWKGGKRLSFSTFKYLVYYFLLM